MIQEKINFQENGILHQWLMIN